MSDQQAVIEDANVEAQPSIEDDNAQDLDSLLSEFDQQAKPEVKPEPQREVADDDDIKWLRQHAEEQRKAQIQKETKQDISSAVTTMKSGLDKDLPEELIEGYLIREVENDPRALGLWQARHTEAGKWNQFVDGIAKKLNKVVSDLPDKKLSDDRDVVTSAIHSASSHKPQEPKVDLNTMSDQEFAMYKLSLRRK